MHFSHLTRSYEKTSALPIERRHVYTHKGRTVLYLKVLTHIFRNAELKWPVILFKQWGICPQSARKNPSAEFTVEERCLAALGNAVPWAALCE